MFPRARQDDLTIRELPDETLVYDRRRQRAHCLNATAALVWRHCDGQTSPAELARLVAAQLGVADAAAVVGLALEQLGRRHLLEEAPPQLPPAAHVCRREALKQFARAAIALPLVLTIATRAAADSVSDQAASDSASDPPINLEVPVTINTGGSRTPAPAPKTTTPAPKTTTPAPGPCRTRGQSCLAAATGQQGTCCAGLRCNGVASGAGVCG
jgi:hypothetical protein